jgi:hypothetical protein
MDQLSMNTARRELERLKDATETFDEIMVRARRLARGMYGDGSKLHYRVRIDRNTGNPVNEGFVAYDPRPRQP